MERKISKNGGITIPSNLRRDLGIQGKEKIDIQTMENGDVLIKRIQGTCIFCGRIDDVEAYKSKFICKKCKEDLGGK